MTFTACFFVLTVPDSRRWCPLRAPVPPETPAGSPAPARGYAPLRVARAAAGFHSPARKTAIPPQPRGPAPPSPRATATPPALRQARAAPLRVDRAPADQPVLRRTPSSPSNA